MTGDLLARYERAVIATERALSQRDSALSALAEREATITRVEAVVEAAHRAPRREAWRYVVEVRHIMDGTP